MPLSDLEIPHEKIEYGSTTINLRPLTIRDFRSLMRTHAGNLADAIAKLAPTLSSTAATGPQAAGAAVLSEAADLIADAIAISAGQPDQAEKAAALPTDIQLAAVVKIARLTFGSCDGEAILRELQAIPMPVAPLWQSAPSGSPYLQ